MIVRRTNKQNEWEDIVEERRSPGIYKRLRGLADHVSGERINGRRLIDIRSLTIRIEIRFGY